MIQETTLYAEKYCSIRILEGRAGGNFKFYEKRNHRFDQGRRISFTHDLPMAYVLNGLMSQLNAHAPEHTHGYMNKYNATREEQKKFGIRMSIGQVSHCHPTVAHVAVQ
jgi:hypothetical protein